MSVEHLTIRELKNVKTSVWSHCVYVWEYVCVCVCVFYYDRILFLSQNISVF